MFTSLYLKEGNLMIKTSLEKCPFYEFVTRLFLKRVELFKIFFFYLFILEIYVYVLKCQ